MDEDRIWFKALQGLDATELPRDAGLYGRELPRPRRARRAFLRGAITARDGYRLGTVNVIDTEPRVVTEEETQTLQELAAIVMDELELRLAAIREVQQEREYRDQAVEAKQRAESLARTLQQTLSPPKAAGGSWA